MWINKPKISVQSSLFNWEICVFNKMLFVYVIINVLCIAHVFVELFWSIRKSAEVAWGGGGIRKDFMMIMFEF